MEILRMKSLIWLEKSEQETDIIKCCMYMLFSLHVHITSAIFVSFMVQFSVGPIKTGR